MSKNNNDNWTAEGYEAFLDAHPDYPIPEEIECLNLLLKKEFALEIINGDKSVDFRTYSQHYCDRLYDKETENYIERHKGDAEVVKWADSLREVLTIHFHDRGYTWSLKVNCNWQGLIWPSDEYIEMLHNDFGCYELDEMNRKLKREKATNYPLFFAFAIGDIIERKNI